LLLLLNSLPPYLLLALADLLLQLVEFLYLLGRQHPSHLCPEPHLHLYLLGPGGGKLLCAPVYIGFVKLLAHQRLVQCLPGHSNAAPRGPDLVVVADVDLSNPGLLLRLEVDLPHYLLPDPLLLQLVGIQPGLLLPSLLGSPLLLVLSGLLLLLLRGALLALSIHPFGLARSLHGVPLPMALGEGNT
jgi:hypothetical protein